MRSYPSISRNWVLRACPTPRASKTLHPFLKSVSEVPPLLRESPCSSTSDRTPSLVIMHNIETYITRRWVSIHYTIPSYCYALRYNSDVKMKNEPVKRYGGCQPSYASSNNHHIFGFSGSWHWYTSGFYSNSAVVGWKVEMWDWCYSEIVGRVREFDQKKLSWIAHSCHLLFLVSCFFEQCSLLRKDMSNGWAMDWKLVMENETGTCLYFV